MSMIIKTVLPVSSHRSNLFAGQGGDGDTGRLIVTENGSVRKQEACKVEILDMLGAAASNYVDLAKTLPPEQLKMKDGFGRTPLMLAAWFKCHDMLEWLSSQLKGSGWQLDAQYSKQASLSPLMLMFAVPDRLLSALL